jgi:hypothetical protein
MRAPLSRSLPNSATEALVKPLQLGRGLRTFAQNVPVTAMTNDDYVHDEKAE